MGFLPNDYDKPPQSGGNYMKLHDGDNRIRIMSPAVIGNVFWRTESDGGRKPVRRRMDEEITADELGVDSHGQRERAKHFWAFAVWNYAESAIQILELTQRTIQDAIYDLDANAEWGDVMGYDINIKKSGKSLDTSYVVTPCKPTDVPPVAADEYAERRPNLDALFTGGDPFDAGDTRSSGQPQQDSHDESAYIAKARENCIAAFKAEFGDKAKDEMGKAANEMFPGKKSADYTEKDWVALEGSLVPF